MINRNHNKASSDGLVFPFLIWKNYPKCVINCVRTEIKILSVGINVEKGKEITVLFPPPDIKFLA